MIDVSDLTFRVGEATLLTDLTFTIPKGGITALIGPNGAGKSTLLHAIAGLTAPARGKVTIDGADIRTARPNDRARLVAILTQNQPMISRLSVRDLVAFGRWPHHRGRPDAEDRRIVSEALEAFALNDLTDRPIDTLSGGQRQRAFVAMAWAQATPWLFLDEPLASLDPRYARDLMARLRELADDAREGRSVVIVLHDLNAAAAWADHVVALKKGALFAAGPGTEVLGRDVLSDLFDTPFSVAELNGRRLVYPD